MNNVIKIIIARTRVNIEGHDDEVSEDMMILMQDDSENISIKIIIMGANGR